MLLRLLRSPRLLAAARDDEGMALAAVMGLVVLMLIISAAVASVTIAATGFTTSTRADVQSQAAADSGIDAAYASISGGAYVCTLTSATGAVPSYSVTIAYNGTTCSGTFGGSPTTALATSTGFAAANGLQGVDGNSATVGANFTLTSASTTSSLDHMVYGGGTVTLPNESSLVASSSGAADADVYGGSGTLSLGCSSSTSTIDGSVTGQGNISLTNGCNVTGTTWAKGAVTLDSATIGGDVYSASNASGNGTADGSDSVTVKNGAQVKGTILANGSIGVAGSAKSCSSGTWNVCGSAVALGGALGLNNGSSVGGSGYATGTITLQNPAGTMVGVNAVSNGGALSVSNQNGKRAIGGYAKINTTVSGISTPSTAVGDTANSCQYGATSPFAKCSSSVTFPTLSPARTFPSAVGYPASNSVAAPPTATMPAISNTSSALSKWTSAGWTIKSYSDCATAQSYINGLTADPGKVLVNVTATGCQLTWNGSQFTAYNDFAIMNPGGFAVGPNGTSGIKSNSTTKRQVSLIVPTGYTSAITTNNATFTNVETLLYTAGDITMTNGLTGFVGQIYAGGNFSGPNNSTLTMFSLSIPGATTSGSGSGATTVALNSRYDVAN